MWKTDLFDGIKDINGNRLIMDSDWNIYLYLVGDVKNNKRKVGKIMVDDKGKEYLFIRKRANHYMKSIDGWGFNSDLIHILPKDMDVVIKSTESSVVFRIYVGEILEKGNYLQFKSKSFERQIFVKKSLFSRGARV